MYILALPKKSSKTANLSRAAFATFYDRIKASGWFGGPGLYKSSPDYVSNGGFNDLTAPVILDCVDKGVLGTSDGSETMAIYIPTSWLALDKAKKAKAIKEFKASKGDFVKQFSFDEKSYCKNYFIETPEFLKDHASVGLDLGELISDLSNSANSRLDYLHTQILYQIDNIISEASASTRVRDVALYYRNGNCYQGNYARTDSAMNSVYNSTYQKVTGVVFKVYDYTKEVISDDIITLNRIECNSHSRLSDGTISSKVSKQILVLAGFTVSTGKDRSTFVPNHSVFNSLEFAGLPYLAISEGGALEPSFYAKIFDVAKAPKNADEENIGSYLMHVLKSGKPLEKDSNISNDKEYDRLDINREIHAKFWLISASRCLIDSMATTLLTSESGSTLSGGLPAEVVSLLFNRNHSEVVAAYTPTSSDPLIKQLTDGQLTGVTVYIPKYDDMFLGATTRYQDDKHSYRREMLFTFFNNTFSNGNVIQWNRKTGEFKTTFDGYHRLSKDHMVSQNTEFPKDEFTVRINSISDISKLRNKNAATKISSMYS